MMYFINGSIATTFYIVSYNILVVFVVVALILGLIARLIILYFDKDFEKIITGEDKK